MIDTDSIPESEVWEPWTPQVGQRVRVRAAGECRTEFPFAFDTWTNKLTALPAGTAHAFVPDGTTGVIFDPKPDWPRSVRGHNFFVFFDQPVFGPTCGRFVLSIPFAAIELEPLP